ncbi:hypothetical protein NCTC12673_gp153 [Campylobacter phage NCTC12673]|uniref:Uncharacterized protein n=2 Tax=Fletchervirus NCTC12673 TaxID=934027 RepID=A0A1B0XW56_9CAUD|nr:hypothetical protein NCTC12673_gp153 [Campylobacter phage NCTC12673]YP_009321638.1 hypothetical protein BOX06_gp039 [Campylobacter phage PC14]AEA86496.1 hypothetical protein [Campylobacter phage NCTC12673]ANH51332.1 hypothetical protein PC14_00039 [Campylobacter phage PC14]
MNIYSIFLNEEVEPQKDLAKKINESSLADYGLDVNGFYKHIDGKESIVETDDFKIKITYDSVNSEFDGDNEELLLKMHCNIIELRYIVTGIEDAMRISDEINNKIVEIIEEDLKKYDDISKYNILIDSGVYIDPDDPSDYIQNAYIIIQPKY